MISLEATMWWAVGIYGITLAYSIYMAYLNRKQAKMYELLKETNEILKGIKNKEE